MTKRDERRVVVISAGPAGLMVGAALAKRGWRVTAIDRDPGPRPDGSWTRRGVMQFGHPHAFRPQVRDFLTRHWPDAWTCWQELGAVPMELPGPRTTALGVRSRRITFERALRIAATRVPHLHVVTGHVDELCCRDGRVVGAMVDGSLIAATLVVDATGRLSRFATAPSCGGDTGMAYITRTYRRRHDAPAGPMTSPVAWYGMFDGYDAYVFPHEHDHLSALIVRPTADPALAALRHDVVFDAACGQIPGLREWTDPAVSTPTSSVLTGGRLLNTYRPQRRWPGLVSIGDAVTTTTPTAGRGVAMATMQIAALVDLFDLGADPVPVAELLEDWCTDLMLPWVEDHVANDTAAVRRWSGEDLDLNHPLPATVIANAAAIDPDIAQYLDGYFHMTQPPRSLAPAEPLARSVYQTGWRPPTTPDQPATTSPPSLTRRSAARSPPGHVPRPADQGDRRDRPRTVRTWYLRVVLPCRRPRQTCSSRSNRPPRPSPGNGRRSAWPSATTVRVPLGPR